MALPYRSYDQTGLLFDDSTHFFVDTDMRTATTIYRWGYVAVAGSGYDATGTYQRVVYRACVNGTIPTCTTAGTHVRSNIATLPNFYGNNGWVLCDISLQEGGGHFVGNAYHNGNATGAANDIKWDVTTGGIFRVSNGIVGMSGGNICAVITYLTNLTVSSGSYLGDVSAV